MWNRENMKVCKYGNAKALTALVVCILAYFHTSTIAYSAANAGFSVCAVGDSITEGGSAFVAHRVALESRFAELGWDVEWKGSHVKSDSGSSNLCEGFSGNSAEQIAAKYETHAADIAADVLLLHAGHNYNGGDPNLTPAVMPVEDIVASATNAHARIIAAARAQNPDVIVLYAKVITSGGNRAVKYSYIPALNEAIAANAAALDTPESPVICVDMADGWDYATDCVSDCVHPNASGAAKMAEKWMAAFTVLSAANAAEVKVYPQSFEAGGWGLDAQFMDVMGSPYLIAHGLGVRVLDAKARVAFPEAGEYRVWVRTKNWADGAPGRFRVIVDGKPLEKEFGAGPREWAWEDGGVVTVEKGEATVALNDLTGFDGRCAGIVFASGGDKPEGALMVDEANVAETVKADFVVVGGGMPGTCAAVAAARRGLKVALVQDRPVLGGNASGEIRVYCAGEAKHPLVRELRNYFMNRDVNMPWCDERRMRIVEDEKNIELRLLTRAFGVEKNVDGTIAAVKALDLKSNSVVRFEAPLFCDATGDGWVGYWAGADWRMGREAKDEFGESRAPEKPDGDTLGASIMWTSADANMAVPFSAPFAEPHAQGVVAVNGEWRWEYGIHRDMIAEGEEIRDRMLLAIYGAFSLAKKRPENANKVLNFCPYLIAKRESRRIMGDWVLSQKDVAGRTPFEDSIATGTWGIDLHYDGYKPGVDFLSRNTFDNDGRFWIPYRSIYSRNVGNLFVVGRCFSCTHVGLGAPRVISTLSQLGVAAGEAAAMCRELGETPRGIYKNGHVRRLQEVLGGGFPGVPDRETAGWLIVDDESDGVKFGKGWRMFRNTNGGHVGLCSHSANAKGAKAEPATYPLSVSEARRYALMGKGPYMWNAKPGSATAMEIVSGGKAVAFTADQAQSTGEWVKFGEFDLEPGATLTIIPAKSRGHVVADGFALVPVRNK